MTLKNPSLVRKLHEVYMKALRKEFELEKRTPEFIRSLIEVGEHNFHLLIRK